MESDTKGLATLVAGVASVAMLAFLTSRIGRIRSRGPKKANVFTIALTGGPCGGKSSCLKVVKAALEKQGYGVYLVPETPTILIGGGAEYPGINGGQSLIEFERGLIDLQLQMENSFLGIAASVPKKSVVICDRGLLDVKAYMPRALWEEVLDAMGLREPDLVARYDLVLHMVTAAKGAEKFYTTANNAARKETPEEVPELRELE
ncbi:unnamed protein product, partial [Heterosigma akashiwo]